VSAHPKQRRRLRCWSSAPLVAAGYAIALTGRPQICAQRRARECSQSGLTTNDETSLAPKYRADAVHRRAPSRRGRVTRVACRMCLQLHEMRAGQRRGACEVPRGQARGSTSSTSGTSGTSGTSHHGGAICPSAVPLPPARLHVRSGVRQPIASAPSLGCRAGVSCGAAQPSRQRARLDRNMQQTACNVQQTACNVQQTTYIRQHATRNRQHGMCGRGVGAVPHRHAVVSNRQCSAAQRSAEKCSGMLCSPAARLPLTRPTLIVVGEADKVRQSPDNGHSYPYNGHSYCHNGHSYP
jgi:hypothetical protein